MLGYGRRGPDVPGGIGMRARYVLGIVVAGSALWCAVQAAPAQ